MIDAQISDTEFTIYTFDKPKNSQNYNLFEWKRHAIHHNHSDALAEAKTLFDSNKFERIEVKKKFFDRRKNKAMDSTIKVLKTSYLHRILKFGLSFIR